MKKKVGIFVYQFPNSSETFIVTKILGLLESGVDLEIFTLAESTLWERFKVLEGRDDVRARINVNPLGVRGSKIKKILSVLTYTLKKFFRYPLGFIRLLSMTIRNRNEAQVSFIAQFIHKLPFIGKKLDILHFEFDYQSYGMLDLKDYLNCKILISARGSMIRTNSAGRYSNFFDYIYGRVDYVHTISNYLVREGKQLGLKDSVPVTKIVPALDLNLFKSTLEREGEGETINILSLGRLDWAKGYEFALDALKKVSREYPTIKYTALGEGSYTEGIFFCKTQHDFQEGVINFPGAVKREEVIEYLENADILLHTALEEGFCNAVLEAQALGIPVVTSDAGGLPENVKDGETGFVVRRRDSDALAEKLLILIRDKELRKRMGENGIKRVREHFNIEDQIKAFYQLYNSID